MRVTQQALINNFLRNLNETNQDLLRVNREISSGKRVERPEDDPIAASAITRINSQLSDTDQFNENIQQSLSELNTVDATLGEVSSLIIRSRELAVQAANDTLSDTERDAIAVEVNQLLESMIQIGNSTIGTRAFFGGHETVGRPFEVVRGSDTGEVRDVITIDGEVRKDINANNVTRVVYKGDEQRSSTEVDQKLTVGSNITGQELFYFDDMVNTSGPNLTKKEVGININTLLENVTNGEGGLGVSKGFLTVRNTRVLHLREDTNPDPNVDNSTKLSQLNNRRGVGRDKSGNFVSLGDVRFTDSQGTSVTVNTNVAPFTNATATIDDAVNFLNSQMYDPVTNPNNPKLRFYIESNGIQVQDNSDGSNILSIEDELGDGVIGANISTFAQDLGITQTLQPKTITAATTPVGLFNEFGGVRLSAARETMSGRLEFNDGTFIEMTAGDKDGQRFVYEDVTGTRTPLFLPHLPGNTTIQGVLDTLDTRLGLAANTHTFADLNTANSNFQVQFSDSTTEQFTLATLGGATASLTGDAVTAVTAGTNTFDEILLQVRNRVVNQEGNGSFNVLLSNGSSFNFNLGRSDLTQSSTLQNVIDELNDQVALLPGAPNFVLNVLGQGIDINTPVGTTIDTVIDEFGSTAAFDLGLLKPFLSVNAGFPNLPESNENFPELSFDERTTLGEWIGETDISSVINGGQIRIQDSTGRELGVNLSTVDVNTTISDFIDLFNSVGSEVVAEFSKDGHGISYRDEAGGSGNFFVEDFAGSSLVKELGVGTPLRGATGSHNAGNMVHLDLRQIGDTINSVGQLLDEINAEVERIGVVASVDEETAQLVLRDARNPEDRGKFRVAVEDAIGKETSLDSLNDGGGINNFKIRVTDSKGISTIFDFQEAETVEDVINSVNLTREVITEKTQLKNIEGFNFPLGSFEVASSFGTATIDLSTLTPASTVLDLVTQMKNDASQAQVNVDLRLDLDERTLSFNFVDLVGGEDDGRISIRDTTFNQARDLKLDTVASDSPFRSGVLVQRRANVTASLNDQRTGLKLVDNFGGELKVTEVEGRTTAHDLGLIRQGPGIASSLGSVLIGKALEPFERIANQLGLSAGLSLKGIENQDVISSRVGYGAANDHYEVVKSKTLKTRELYTLEGSVDMDHRLTANTKLSLLDNATENPDFSGNMLERVDLSGILKIESLSDDGTGNYERVNVDLKNLPDNPTWEDLDRLIQQEITADENFQATVQMDVRADGTMRFVSEIPIRFGKDDSYDAVTSPNATAQQVTDATTARGANTALDMFGSELTDFSHVTTGFLDVKPKNLGGVELENFFIDDFSGNGSLEVDLNTIMYEVQDTQRSLELGDLVEHIQVKAQRPTVLTDTVLLEDLGVKFPVSTTYTVADPEFNAFNGLTEASTLGDFITAFNAIGAPSVFNGTVQLAIADGTNSDPADTGKKLVILDQTGLLAGGTLEIRGIPRETNLFFDKLGLKMGGTVKSLSVADIGIEGDQITGLGYEPEIEIDPLGMIKLQGVPSVDSVGKEIAGTGRMVILEGRGTTANDLRLLTGTGAIGDKTRIIHSGDMNPSVARQSLLSEISPKQQGLNTSFEDTLHELYVENGKDTGLIDLMNPQVTMRTPFKAFNEGEYDSISGFYRGGVDVGRPGSGFVITDQFGNAAIVDLSNDRSASSPVNVANVTASNIAATTTRLTGAAGDFSAAQLDDYVEIDSDGNGLESRQRKFKVINVDPAGAFIDVEADPTTFDLAANNYSINLFTTTEDLQASMEREYSNKPFYSRDSDLTHLQRAIDIALDKAKRTTGYGVDKIEIVEEPESGGFRLLVSGVDGPTITLTERDLDNDGTEDSSSASDLGLLRDSGAKGNGTPEVTSGPATISPSIAYILDKINKDLSDVNVTASLGTNGKGPTIDITSNTDSSYLKVRDSQDGNSASQLGMSSTRSIFQTMIDFRDSLFRNDSKTISALVLEKIGEDEERVLQVRAQVGSVVNRFQVGEQRLVTNKIELTKRLSDNQDLEITDAIIELRQLENSQRAALSIGSRIIQQTLLDFLR